MTNSVYLYNFQTIDDPEAGATGGTEALGINDAGAIAGLYYFAAEGATGNFIHQDGAATQLGAAIETISGVDDAGLIIGNSNYSNEPESVIDDQGPLIPVADPLAASGKGGTILTGISDDQIVGYSADADGVHHGFTADFAPGILPVISGAIAGQRIVDRQTDTPFSRVTITDANTPGPTDVVTVTLSDPANGALSNLDGGAYDAATGVYTVSGSAAAVTAAVDGLVFTPDIAPGATATTTFSIAVDDGLAPTVTDATTTVTVSSTLGGGQTVPIGGGPGHAVSLYDTDDDWDTVTGVGTVDLTSAQASMFGMNDFVYFQGGVRDAVSLYGTDDDWDTARGDNGAITLNSAQVSAFGGNEYIYFNNGSGNAASLYATDDDWDTVKGNFGSITLNDAQASVFGQDDAVYFNGPSGDAVSLYATGAQWDTVHGSGGSVTLNSANASVLGKDNWVYFTGGGPTAASLYDTFGDWDTVNGSGGVVTLNGAQASVFGGADWIYLQGAGSAASLYGFDADDDFVIGDGGAVTLNDAKASLNGTGNSIYFNGENQLTLNGGSDVLSFQVAIGDNTIGGFDATDTLQFSAADFANFAALSAHLTQSYANAVITLDADDFVTLTNVSASSLTAAEFRFV